MTTAVWSSPAKGHDRSLVTDRFAGVADGATPLTSGERDPGDFAQAILESLAASVSSNSESFSLAETIRDVARQGWANSTASCSLVFARATGTHIHFGRMGDCSILVGMIDGHLHRLLDTDIRPLDAAARAAPDSAATRKRHRAMMNTPEGYWIVADDDRAAEHLDELYVPASEVAWFMLASDGVPANLDPAMSDDLAFVVGQAVRS